MRKLVKTICLVLSFILLFNLAGFEVAAADISNQQDEADEVKNEGTGAETDTDASSEEKDVPVKDDAGTTETDIPEQPEESIPAEGNTDVNQESPEAEAEPEKEDTEQKQEEEEDTLLDAQTSLEAQTVEGLTAKLVAGANNELEISWNTVAEATNYQVKVLKYSDNTLVKQYDTADTSCIVEVVQGEKYYIEVTASKEGVDFTAIGKIPAILLASPSVTATTTTTAANLSWKSVTGASKYRVVYGSVTKDVSTTSYKAEKLTKAKKYSFNVYAICEFTENNKTYTYISDVTNVTATTKNEIPAKVKTLTGIDGNSSVVLTWSKTTRATTYSIYRYNATKKKWEVIKNGVTKLTYTDTGLKQGKTYKYRVAAVNDGGSGDLSPTVSVSVKKTPATVRTIGYKAVVKSRAPLFTSSKSKVRVKYLKVGTKVTTIDYGSKRYKIKLSNGKTYWISKDRLRFTASIWTTKDYSTKTKQDFVNKKGYKSKSKYLIWINHYTQRVVIYQGSKGKWKVLRSGRCATGTHNHMTPKGVFKITKKTKGFFYKYTYEKPGVYFTSGVAFHSRIKRYGGGYSDATIGRPKSHGCVRLMDADINFIYKYCPKGTTVVSY